MRWSIGMSGRFANNLSDAGRRMSSEELPGERRPVPTQPAGEFWAPVLSTKAEEQIRDLLSDCATQRLEFHSGDRVVSEGDASRELFRLCEGELAVCQRAPSGAETVHTFYYPDEILFPVAPGGVWTHTVRALSDGALDVYRFEDVRRICQADGGLAYRLFLAACRTLSLRVEQAARLRSMTVEGRFAAFLLEAGARIGSARRGGVVLSLPMSRTDIASYLGLRTETLSRIIRRWRDRGLIDLESARRIAIRDTKPLEQLALEPAACGPGPVPQRPRSDP